MGTIPIGILLRTKVATGMMIENDLMPGRTVNMSVDLSRGYALMAEHFLNHTQVGSMFDKMCSE